MGTNKERRESAMRSLEKEIKSRDRAEKTKPLGVVAAAAVAVLAIVGGIYWANSSDDSTQTQASDQATPTTEESNFTHLAMKRAKALGDTVTCTYNDAGNASKDVSKPKTESVSAKGTTTVSLDTNKGKIDLELDRAASPCTVNAIEHLAKQKYYDDTVCHRLTTSGIYVLQCGDPSGKGSGGPGFQFDNEYPTDEASDKQTPVVYPRGSIAMANAGEGTNGSQFFLNYKDSPLPPDYTYFGKISDAGLKTLDKIAEAGVKDGGTDGAPAEEVKIRTAAVS
ncbi:peptidylprolyl isomerase [Corynebacterium diphtheriae]|uniref:peptidylprolyl isomerase n=1 Tax=Corynebacterium diphtheriae TaxID=1717 RepID=UPI0013CAB8B5|nr:peptidylprolyl isomerase [Corynebacterium diphtheriae]MBG9312936.1 peptidylprolyl isomerase [Corynebacterium diphtheriae bv. mitis]CAB0689742.1 peptidylprolyl isomerase [Corynebacterium diphtheriae]CAB0696881.1 peptidylprolyl isomerase [Corynebacterium diphtheriae]CAB0700067.1 peptidylprolyl isomerase [Corynebacterium diphtheriae]CAB0700434.1 peptidylprolyl isomerase [Corynebacterium diphtheriae]